MSYKDVVKAIWESDTPANWARLGLGFITYGIILVESLHLATKAPDVFTGGGILAWAIVGGLVLSTGISSGFKPDTQV